MGLSSDEFKRSLGERWVVGPDGVFRKLRKAGRLVSDAVSKPNPEYVSAPKDEGEVVDQKRRVVRITSFRKRLCDERNLWDKHFTDALQEAGIIVSDAPQHATIQVRQEKVAHDWEERTEIEVDDEV